MMYQWCINTNKAEVIVLTLFSVYFFVFCVVKAALIDKDKVAGVCCLECATVVITLMQFQIISCYVLNAKS